MRSGPSDPFCGETTERISVAFRSRTDIPHPRPSALALVKARVPHYPAPAAPADWPRGRRHQRSPPLTLHPASPDANLLNIGAGRRTLAIGLAIVIAGLMLFLLLAFGVGDQPEKTATPISVITLEAAEIPEDAPEPGPAASEKAETRPSPPAPVRNEPPPTLPLPSQVTEPSPASPPPVAAERLPTPTTPTIGVRPPNGQVYGPPNRGGSPSAGDTARVGTAPNGEPLYAAAWYREPSDDELRGFLSTASGPGWGLIACRTAPDYRVEDCVGLDEYPNGSQITRAVLAAAWQFRVRPPRLGGKPMVGAWVRIRIDYGIKRR